MTSGPRPVTPRPEQERHAQEDGRRCRPGPRGDRGRRTNQGYPLVRAYQLWQGSFLTDTSVAQGRRVAVLGATTASDLGLDAALTTSDGRTIEVDAAETTWHRQAAATRSDVTTGTSVQVIVSGMGGLPGAGPGSSTAPASFATTATM